MEDDDAAAAEGRSGERLIGIVSDGSNVRSSKVPGNYKSGASVDLHSSRGLSDWTRCDG